MYKADLAIWDSYEYGSIACVGFDAFSFLGDSVEAGVELKLYNSVYIYDINMFLTIHPKGH